MSPRDEGAGSSLRDAAPLFAALGDEMRLRIVRRLCARGPTSIAALTQGSGITRQAVAKHLRVLASAGLVHGMREGRESSWALRPERLEEARRSLASISRQWADALGRLKAFVESPAGSRSVGRR
jgi:DNA-binding transcriptional ArsR family regulator